MVVKFAQMNLFSYKDVQIYYNKFTKLICILEKSKREWIGLTKEHFKCLLIVLNSDYKDHGIDLFQNRDMKLFSLAW